VAGANRAVHVLPLVEPVSTSPAHIRRFSGTEDRPTPLKLSAINELSLCMDAVVTSLPKKGKLYAIQNGYSAASQLSTAIEIKKAGHVLNHTQTGNYLLFVPEANDFGAPYALFNVSFRLQEEPGMTSDPITITVDVAASNDVPQVTQNVDSISLEEDSSGQTVQLQASPGDPMEGNEPLEIFITRLPTRGKVKCSRAHTAAHACVCLFAPVNPSKC
jgi:hypothetical protein